MKRVGRVLGLLVVLSGVDACDGNDSISIDDLGERQQAAFCRWAVRCGTRPNVAACMTADDVDLGQVVADVKSGRVVYDGAAAGACLRALDARNCSVAKLLLAPSPQACLETFKGTVPATGACFINEECISGSCDLDLCATTTAVTCCAGTCEPGEGLGRVPIGGSCRTNDACVPDAFCPRTFTGGVVTGVCTQRAAMGQPCNPVYAPSGCVSSAACIPDRANSNICGMLPSRGQLCGPANLIRADATILPCDSTFDFCDLATSTCIPRSAVGGACHSGIGCSGYARCDATTSTCVALGLASQACDPSAGFVCLGNLSCSPASVCAPPPADPLCPTP